MKPKEKNITSDPFVRQRAASNPEKSIWVGASAGSGKTTVLVSRVLRLLLSGVGPQKILCLTFTKAAAAEMAIRVTAQLSRWATCTDDDLRQDLDKLQGTPPGKDQLVEARRLFARTLSCPGGMRIRTIHAFCQEILRRFPIEAGLPPHFNVNEEASMQILEQEVKEELLRQAAEKPDSKAGKAINFLVKELGERGFSEAIDAVSGERAKIESLIAKEGGLDAMLLATREGLNLGADETAEHIKALAVASPALSEATQKDAAIQLLSGTKSYKAKGERILAWLTLSSEDRAATFEEWCGCFLKVDGDLFQNYGDKKLLAQFPRLDSVLRDEAMRLRQIIERIEAAQLFALTNAVVRLGILRLRMIGAKKKAQALLDYDDLIMRTDTLLSQPDIAPWVLYKLDGGIDHILVDEAQDTSRAQWNIVANIALEFFAGLSSRSDVNRTVFVVGDEKQSIFSFQHADPAAFAEMRSFFASRIAAATKPWEEIALHMSFRSAPAILKAVDAVFLRDEARAGVAREKVQHEAFMSERQGLIEVWPLIAAQDGNTDADVWTATEGYEDEHDPQVELAGLIADRIAHWIEKKERLAHREDPIGPADIMILLRRRGRFADLMVRALKQRKIPVTGVDRMQLMQQIAVMDLCALMQFTLLPEDDLNLATVLKSPLIRLTEEELMHLAIGREFSLWHSLNQKAEGSRVLGKVRDYLKGWLAAADVVSPYGMVAGILGQACPGSEVSGRHALWSRLGPDAIDPLDELLSAAQEFGHRQASSLQAFLHWLFASDTEIKRQLDSSGGQVRIMTVHASKGLEASIVFLPDTRQVPRAREMPKLHFTEEGAPLYLARRPSNSMAAALWETARQKQLEEYRRLLYVALTRAADRLYICGWENARGETLNSEQSWYALISDALRPAAEEFLADDLLPKPSIRISDEELKARSIDKKPVQTHVKAPLPAWVREKAPVETALAKALAPSRFLLESDELDIPAAAPDERFKRGRIIHRLLQSLPDVADPKRDEAAQRFLANPQHRLSKAIAAEIKKEVLAIIRDERLAPLFGQGSRAEVAVAGRLKDELIVGKIDRLAIQQDEIWIIDYKSNRPPPLTVDKVPLPYLKQLQAYAGLLQAIYDERKVKCFLLWTYGPKLMAIPEVLISGA